MGHLTSLNPLDLKIIKCLQRDCRQPLTELSKAVGSSKSACHRRVKLLEEAGIIKGYRAEIDFAALGYSMFFVTHVSLNGQSKPQLEEFETAIQSIAEIQECFLMTGNTDYFLKVNVKDVGEYERFHQRLAGLRCVSTVSSSLSLRLVKKQMNVIAS